MNNNYSIGIDLGGTNLRIALVSEEGKVIKKIRVPSGDKVVASLSDSIAQIINNNVVGIGIGVAGLIDRVKGVVLRSPNLPSIEGVEVTEILKERFKVPVMIENDANVAALGEKWLGAGREFRDFVLLTLGTGIGGGVIYEGRLLNISAEIGHMVILAGGTKCSCGNLGCLETYASARAILTNAIKALEEGSESSLRKLYEGNFYKLSAEDVYNMALDGDSLSRDILREAGRYLGIGISNVVNIFSPEAVILAGGLAGAWNIYVQEAIREASRRCFKELFDKTKVLPSTLKDDAGILGAACLAFTCQKR
ncbi:MAG: ROK family protein [Thermodesulfovibrionales bacterium]